VASGADKTTGVWQVAVITARQLSNPRLLAFLLIASIFWAVFTQLWDMLPNFIVDWVDSSSLARHLPGFMLARDLGRGPQIAQEWVINVNPFLIILFVAPLSWFVNRKMRRLTSIFWGFVIASLGVYGAGSSRSIYICLTGIACFSVGEMLCSPKLNEYLGVIAPPDQKALFMGYANIPMALGWGYGSFIAGQIYARAGEKAGLALRYLSEVLQVKELPHRTQAFSRLTEMLGQNPAQVTQLLWDKYDPSQVWTPFALVGLLAALALCVFNHLARKWEEVNA
jgi:hypothetical protein